MKETIKEIKESSKPIPKAKPKNALNSKSKKSDKQC